MKTITIIQPWASLVACGAKKIETRGWRTNYRGPLAIHAAQGMTQAAREFALDPRFAEALKPLEPGCYLMGAVIATCRLVDCLPTEGTRSLPRVFDRYPELWTEAERAFGNYSPGRWAWVLADVQKLPEPIPAKGALALWEWDEKCAGGA